MYGRLWQPVHPALLPPAESQDTFYFLLPESQIKPDSYLKFFLLIYRLSAIIIDDNPVGIRFHQRFHACIEPSGFIHITGTVDPSRQLNQVALQSL